MGTIGDRRTTTRHTGFHQKNPVCGKTDELLIHTAWTGFQNIMF